MMNMHKGEEKTIIKKRGKVTRRRNVCLFVCLFV